MTRRILRGQWPIAMVGGALVAVTTLAFVVNGNSLQSLSVLREPSIVSKHRRRFK